MKKALLCMIASFALALAIAPAAMADEAAAQQTDPAQTQAATQPSEPIQMEATASEEGPTVDAATYKITKNVSSGGQVILVGPDGQVTSNTNVATMTPAAGKTVYFRTNPNVGYTLSTFNVTYIDPKTKKQVKLTNGNGITRVSGTGKAGTNSVYRFTMPAAPVTLSATFAVNKRDIAKSIYGGGQLMLCGADGKASSSATMHPQVGTNVYFRSVPDSGWALQKINITFKDESGATVKLGLTKVRTGLYTFKMPNYNVTLNGEFDAAIEPTFKYWCSSETDTTSRIVGFYIHNTSPRNIYIKSSALTNNEDANGYTYGGRWAQNLRLINDNGQDISSQCVAPGEETWVWWRTADNGSLSYDAYTTIVFQFTHNGLNYRGTVSAYHDGTYTLLD